MQPLLPVLPTLAVAMVYCLFDMHRRLQLRRKQQQLRSRVTYMLWMAANQIDADSVEC